MCDCTDPENTKKTPKDIIKNLLKEEENWLLEDPTNCTEVCKNTSDGFPLCECDHPDGPKLLKNQQKSSKLVPKSHDDDNHSDLYDCEVICKNTSDGFPMCDCNNKPPTLIQKHKIQKRKRILPIQLFKNQKILPFAHYYP